MAARLRWRKALPASGKDEALHLAAGVARSEVQEMTITNAKEYRGTMTQLTHPLLGTRIWKDRLSGTVASYYPKASDKN